MVVDSVAFPHGLVALHPYSPVWDLVMFLTINTLPSGGWSLLTFIQETSGSGMPDALQRRVTLPPSLTTLSGIVCIDEDTGNQR